VYIYIYIYIYSHVNVVNYNLRMNTTSLHIDDDEKNIYISRIGRYYPTWQINVVQKSTVNIKIKSK